MTIFLCGFMGCGKTTIGTLLAEKLGVSYTDMDEYIVHKENMTIPEIFSEKGEDYFRQTETAVISELGEKNGVVSCGGGAMIREINALTAESYGTVIFLDVPFEICYERIAGDTNRPIVSNNSKKQLENVYDTRYPIYKKHSSILVKADGTPEEVSEKLVKILTEKYK